MTPDLDALRQRQQRLLRIRQDLSRFMADHESDASWSGDCLFLLTEYDTLLTCLDAQQPEHYLPRTSFWEITEAMITKGGGFVQQLGRLLRQADETNKRKLVLAFQDYWKQYDELAALLGTAPTG